MDPGPVSALVAGVAIRAITYTELLADTALAGR
jgi:hypothetical protein